jgi:hypothetical protein
VTQACSSCRHSALTTQIAPPSRSLPPHTSLNSSPYLVMVETYGYMRCERRPAALLASWSTMSSSIGPRTDGYRPKICTGQGVRTTGLTVVRACLS